jgi:dihydrofolate reductase
MYETMLFWESPPEDMDESSRQWHEHWRATDKIVYSRTLTGVAMSRARLERTFEPHSIELLKRTSDRDLSLGGSDLASQAFAAGLIDEIQLIIVPQMVGGGKSWFPEGWRHRLELTEARKFDSGFVLLRYLPAEGSFEAS